MNTYSDIKLDDDYSVPALTELALLQRSFKSNMIIADHGAKELLWRNGRVMILDQRQRSINLAVSPTDLPEKHDDPSSSQNDHPLSVQGDEVPCSLRVHDHILEGETRAKPSQPIAANQAADVAGTARFSKSLSSVRKKETSVMKAVVDSNITPAEAGLKCSVSELFKSMESPRGRSTACRIMSKAEAAAAAATSPAIPAREHGSENSKEASTDNETLATSSTSDPTASEQPPSTQDRKRKGIAYLSEDVCIESTDGNKQNHASISTKRSRASETHNLSEKKGKDKINEGMQNLQNLFPHCKKSNGSAILDEAIGYLKSLQSQMGNMTMESGVLPTMVPGAQQFMTPNTMGMGMGMDMATNQPMMPYQSVLASATLPTQAPAPQSVPRYHAPGFHVQSVPNPYQARMQAKSQHHSLLNAFGMLNRNRPLGPSVANPYQARMQANSQHHSLLNRNQPRGPSVANPYQYYPGLQQTQPPPPPTPQNEVANQATVEPSTCSEDDDNPKTHRGDEYV